jgi:subtilisin family serine protease
MNRSNIWIHITLAVILITIAGVLGQIDRWRSSLNNATSLPSETKLNRCPMIPAKEKRTVPEVLVRFKTGVSLDRIRAIASDNHDRLTDEIESVDGLSFIDDLDDGDAQAVAHQYAAMADVDYAEANFEIKLDDPIVKEGPRDLVYHGGTASHPDDPMFGEQWALNNSGQDGGTARADLDALEAWLTTQGSKDVVVAVLDTGVDFTHEDLRENMWFRPASIAPYKDDEIGEFNDLNGFNGTDQILDPMDDNGHGTHCAGIIGAEGDNGIGISGINWKVKIMPLKFLGRNGSGSASDAIEAINYAIDRKQHGVNVRVISASWGSRSKSKALEDAIRAAADAGILFVAAAGNDGGNNDHFPHYPSNYNLPNVISVAALDRTDHLASFSNFGARTVHIAAPGKDILSTWLKDDYREASGTSMATPYVSGIAALIIAGEPRITMEKVRERLLNTADKLDSLNGRVATGGRVCAANALVGKAENHQQH